MSDDIEQVAGTWRCQHCGKPYKKRRPGPTQCDSHCTASGDNNRRGSGAAR